MKRIERRAGLCLLLAAALVLGLGIFTFRELRSGGAWAASAFNRHIYNSKGQLAVGRVLDRDGDLLSWVDAEGNRAYYANPTVRKATLHAVGVYNYKTGEILCMVSNPSYDPADPPEIQEGDERYEGVYLNRFLSGTFVPGSVFKTVTLAAAAEHMPDLMSRTFTCTGSTLVGGEAVTCPGAHGELDIYGALASSCNGVFAQLATELGPEVMEAYTRKAGLTGSYRINGLSTAKGRFQFSGATANQLGWAGVGQYNDLVNPCTLMVYMGAIASGGKAAVPQLILQTVTPLDFRVSLYVRHRTGRLVEADTAELLADMMARNVAETYGSGRFPNMDLCAKSGTGEVGGGKAPNAWFAGFLRNEDAPYAFVVLVENGGSGAEAAGGVAAKVLNALVNGD